MTPKFFSPTIFMKIIAAKGDGLNSNFTINSLEIIMDSPLTDW